jgi:putative endonuclease
MGERTFYTYMLASRSAVLYVGITGDLERRIAQHRNGTFDGFTSTYRCHKLVWFERYTTPTAAIAREKQLKGWRRAKKLALIHQHNPAWNDLSQTWGKAFSPLSPSSTSPPQPRSSWASPNNVCHPPPAPNAVILSERSESKDPHRKVPYPPCAARPALPSARAPRTIRAISLGVTRISPTPPGIRPLPSSLAYNTGGIL